MTITSALRHLIPQEELTEPLSPVELHRLEMFKWAYYCNALGFTPEQARGLCFYRWLWKGGRMGRSS